MRGNLDDTSKPIESSLQDISLSDLTLEQRFYPSPASWEDEVLYFRFRCKKINKGIY